MPNAIGDSIMAMRAVLRLETILRRTGEDRLVLAARGGVAPLWRRVLPDLRLVELQGLWRIDIRVIRELGALRADLLPETFRSALVACLAGIPWRSGVARDFRGCLLTHPIMDDRQVLHRSQTYARVLGVDAAEPSGEDGIDRNKLLLLDNQESRSQAESSFWPRPAAGRPALRVALLPGAARGPAKRWPLDRFVAVARVLRQQALSARVLGGPEDYGAGQEIAAAADLGPEANLCGRTGLMDWVDLISGCDLVVCNDSGGMHVAAALHVPLVAIFGTTDPKRTGPQSPCATVLQRATGPVSERIQARSLRAQEALAAVGIDDVVAAIAHRLHEDRGFSWKT